MQWYCLQCLCHHWTNKINVCMRQRNLCLLGFFKLCFLKIQVRFAAIKIYIFKLNSDTCHAILAELVLLNVHSIPDVKIFVCAVCNSVMKCNMPRT